MYATPPSRILLQHLIDVGELTDPASAGVNGWGGTASGSFATDPIRLLLFTDVGSFKQGRVMNSGERVVPPRVQVNLRGKTYPEAWAKLVGLVNYLSGLGARPDGPWFPAPVSLDWANGSAEQFLLNSVTVVAEPNFIGEERDTKRQMFGAVLQLNLEQLTEGNADALIPSGAAAPSEPGPPPAPGGGGFWPGGFWP